MNKIYFILYFIFLGGCSEPIFSPPIIGPIYPINEDKNCSSISIDYYHRFDYKISNYFEFTYAEGKDLNGDGVIDSIAILTPLELLPDFEFCQKRKTDSVESRLLLVNLMNADGTVLKKMKYRNVVSNEPTSRIKSGSEYIDISMEGTTFSLFQDYGQGCYAQYYIYIDYSIEIDELLIDSIVFKNFCPSEKQENIIKYPPEKSPKLLKDYNRDILLPFKQMYNIF